MPHYTDYVCSKCAREVTRDEARRGKLVRKIVQFVTFGERPRIIKSITVMFLCEEDMHNDADYQRAPNRGPGQRSAGLEKVRRAQSAVQSVGQ
jgi:hypothetical protein